MQRMMMDARDVNSWAYYLGNETAKKKIMLVGNSITWHEPKEELGWHGNWGMAASAPEKDYAHRLFDMLVADGQDVLLRVSRCKRWELTLKEEGVLSKFAQDRAFDADIVVFRLGENVPMEDAPIFKEALRSFVEYVCPRGKMLFTTGFWPNPTLDSIIKEVAAERGEAWVDCGFSTDKANMAIGQFENEAVAAHPSDAGMEAIAKAIFAALKE